MPVGDDQRQHIELARDVAARFNSRYGEALTLPEVATPRSAAGSWTSRSRTKKMSTTGGTPKGTVLVADPPDTIRKKFKVAVTDSGREVRRGPDKAGVANLVEIMAVATGVDPEEIEDRYDGQGYGPFKLDVAEAVITLLEPVRIRYTELAADPAELERLLRKGAEKARAASEPTLRTMYDRMGFAAP